MVCAIVHLVPVFHRRPDLDSELLNPLTKDGPAVAGKGRTAWIRVRGPRSNGRAGP
jgi:hypothetical protein